jgi:hypothetical protein
MKLFAATVALCLPLVGTIRTIRHRNLRRLALFIALVLRTTDVDAAPALPGEPCQVDPRPIWSETEKWVWSRVCVGEIADLNAHFGGEPPEPSSPERWTNERKLSSTFLEAVLLHDPWRIATPRRGVRIVGAWIEKVDLNEAYITQELWLEGSRFTSDLDLSGMRTTTLFSLI